MKESILGTLENVKSANYKISHDVSVLVSFWIVFRIPAEISAGWIPLFLVWSTSHLQL